MICQIYISGSFRESEYNLRCEPHLAESENDLELEVSDDEYYGKRFSQIQI